MTGNGLPFSNVKFSPIKSQSKEYLGALTSGDKVDVLVVGAGPAGLAIAAETAKTWTFRGIDRAGYALCEQLRCMVG